MVTLSVPVTLMYLEAEAGSEKDAGEDADDGAFSVQVKFVSVGPTLFDKGVSACYGVSGWRHEGCCDSG